jgi:hypothetical protein
MAGSVGLYFFSFFQGVSSVIYFAHFVVPGACLSMMINTHNPSPAQVVVENAQVCLSAARAGISLDQELPLQVHHARGNLSHRKVYNERDVLHWIYSGMPALFGSESIYPPKAPDRTPTLSRAFASRK